MYVFPYDNYSVYSVIVEFVVLFFFDTEMIKQKLKKLYLLINGVENP